MAGTLHGGPLTWKLTRDEDGHRDYEIVHLVRMSSPGDGPYQALSVAALPQPGDTWAYGGDADPWATCILDAEVTVFQEKEGDPTKYYRIKQTFSTRPTKRRCLENEFTNPLLEPQKKSGGSVKYTEEATHDRHGDPILSSSHEMLRGPQNEWDASRLRVRIEQNVADLELDLVAQMLDTVNEDTLWGFPARTIKLSQFDYEEKYYGSCNKYYTRIFEFDIIYKRQEGVSSLVTGTGTYDLDPVLTGDTYTWDRYLLDEGTKVLKGRWSTETLPGATSPGGWELLPIVSLFGVPILMPDEDNPTHFIRAVDRQGNPMRLVLDGHGRPYDPDQTTSGTGDDQPGRILVEKYGESNFLLLRIPTTL